MRRDNKDILSYVGIIVSVLAGLISIYAQYIDPQTGLVFFLALIGTIFLYFLFSWPIEYLQRRFRTIDLNVKDIQEIKKDLNILKDKLNFQSEVSRLDSRISVIEKMSNMKNKRGQIDPRGILIIIILILLFLYLRAKGYI